MQYEDDTFEPVNEHENINNKKRGPGTQDWWTVTRPPDWLPDQYADTKRGKAAEKELGTANQPKQKTPGMLDEQPETAWPVFRPAQNKAQNTAQNKSTAKGSRRNQFGTLGIMGMKQEEIAPFLAGLEEKEQQATKPKVSLMSKEQTAKATGRKAPGMQLPVRKQHSDLTTLAERNTKEPDPQPTKEQIRDIIPGYDPTPPAYPSTPYDGQEKPGGVDPRERGESEYDIARYGKEPTNLGKDLARTVTDVMYRLGYNPPVYLPYDGGTRW